MTYPEPAGVRRIVAAMQSVIDMAVEDGAALDRVHALVEKWENATDLGTGQPSIVARAFAAEVRQVLEGDPTT